MRSPWTYSRLKAASLAIANGQLDEAYERLNHPEMLQSGPAQQSLDALADGLMARVRLHAQAGRPDQALLDIERITALGRANADVRAFEERMLREQRAQAQRAGEHRENVQRAVNQLQHGRLESGRITIEQVADARAREALQRQLDGRVRRNEQLLEQARAALAERELLAAAQFWQEALDRHGRSQSSDGFAAELAAALRGQMGAWMDEGRVDRVRALLRGASGLAAFDPQWEEYRRFDQWVRQAVEHVEQRRWEELPQTLARVRALRPQAAWVAPALSAAGEAAQAHAQLLAGPLGLLCAAGENPERRRSAERRPVPHEAGAGERTVRMGSQALLLIVDGAGSFLLLPQARAAIGRGTGVDVSIPASIRAHHADVGFDGEDYFLVAHGVATVNGQVLTYKLLRSGDRVELGSRARFMFLRPSTRSETAVLRLSDRCRLAQDVSAVLLFRETLMIGAHGACHVRTRDGATRVVLFERDGRLYAGAAGGAGDNPRPLVLDESFACGDVRLVVKEFPRPAEASIR